MIPSMSAESPSGLPSFCSTMAFAASFRSALAPLTSSATAEWWTLTPCSDSSQAAMDRVLSPVADRPRISPWRRSGILRAAAMVSGYVYGCRATDPTLSRQKASLSRPYKCSWSRGILERSHTFVAVPTLLLRSPNGPLARRCAHGRLVRIRLLPARGGPGGRLRWEDRRCEGRRRWHHGFARRSVSRTRRRRLTSCGPRRSRRRQGVRWRSWIHK